jgi:ABC-type nitrate/sulfonate/bicarbonate transport system permease component
MKPGKMSAGPLTVPAPEYSDSTSWYAGYLRQFSEMAIPILVLLTVWELVARFGGMPASLFPPLEAIGRALIKMASDGELAADLAGTFTRLFESVVAGIVFGTIVGTCMGHFRMCERALVVPMNFLLAIPGTALFPLTMMWFGLTEAAIISILIYEVALTVTVTTWTGVKSIDNSLIRAGRVFGANGLAILWRVLIPAAMPSIISGYRIAFSRAWRILIIAEMLVAVSAGLGYRLYFAREYFQYDLVYAGLFVVGISGLLIERVILRTLEIITINRWGTVRELK